MPRIAESLIGKRFHRLIVVSRAGNAGKELRWNCICDCGIEKVIYGLSLKSGSTRSCGCLAIEKTKARATTHGMYGTPEWRAWASLRSRCYTPTNKNYKNYGGRGISVCDEWKTSFDAFYTDMGDRPSSSHQIDRIDNNGNYSKENCRWTTRLQNMRNRRVTVKYGGLTLMEISNKTGINYNTIKTRAYRGLIERDE